MFVGDRNTCRRPIKATFKTEILTVKFVEHATKVTFISDMVKTGYRIYQFGLILFQRSQKHFSHVHIFIDLNE